MVCTIIWGEQAAIFVPADRWGGVPLRLAGQTQLVPEDHLSAHWGVGDAAGDWTVE